MALLSSRAMPMALYAALSWAILSSASPPPEKSVATLFARDVLVATGQETSISVRLDMPGGRQGGTVAGQPLELLLGKRVVGEAVTDASGHAQFRYVPKVKGTAALIVRGKLPSTSIASTVVLASAWERRAPLLAVEFAALEQEPGNRNAIAGAADELGKLSLFYYNILYVVSGDEREDRAFQINAEVRRWLADNKFPVGYIAIVPDGGESFGPTLDRLRASGWTTLKAGVGRSRGFAETFLQRRLEAVMVPEPARGEAPKKAKVAREWKDVRKQL